MYLNQSVKHELERRGYIVPDKIRIFKDNPFAEPTDDTSEDVALHRREGVKHLRNNVQVADADRSDEHPFYVLVSKLQPRQLPVDG